MVCESVAEKNLLGSDVEKTVWRGPCVVHGTVWLVADLLMTL